MKTSFGVCWQIAHTGFSMEASQTASSREAALERMQEAALERATLMKQR